MLFRTLRDGKLLSSRHCHPFACHRQDRSLVTNPYRKSLGMILCAEELVDRNVRKGLKRRFSKEVGVKCS